MRPQAWLLGALSLVGVAMTPLSAIATTWNEPWHDDVVRAAESLVKGEVVKVESNGTQASVRLVRNIVGVALTGDFLIEGFYSLQLTTLSSGHAPRLQFLEGKPYYFFVKPAGRSGAYSIATPTTGFARVEGDKVYATYRHSYHQALVPEPLYVESQTAIFHALHSEPFDRALSGRLSDTWLTQPPQAPENPESSKTFFAQHVALETLFHTRAAGVDPNSTLTRLAPFLSHDAEHVQISAVRALSVIDSPRAQEELVRFLEGKHSGFAKIMAIWGLKRLNARQWTTRLKSLYDVADTKETGFGGNIMDPRVGTHFPDSVKQALGALLGEWRSNASDTPAAPPASATAPAPSASSPSTSPPAAVAVPPGPHGCGGCTAAQDRRQFSLLLIGLASVVGIVGLRRRRSA